MMLRKASSPTNWMQLSDVPPKARDRIAAAFGPESLRYDPNTETLSLPSRMRGVTWEQYDALLQALPDHRLRHTYDRGFLEFMSPLYKHDKLKKIIGSFIEQMALSLGIDFEPSGSATYRRRSADRGLEPDETYHIANASAMQGKLDTTRGMTRRRIWQSRSPCDDRRADACAFTRHFTSPKFGNTTVRRCDSLLSGLTANTMRSRTAFRFPFSLQRISIAFSADLPMSGAASWLPPLASGRKPSTKS